MRRICLSFLLLMVAGIACAQTSVYTCEIKQIRELNASGSMGISAYDSLLVRKKFTVDEATGIITGQKFLRTSRFETVTVISNGRQANDFRAVSVGRPPTSMTTFLYINKNSSLDEKPFFFIDTSFLKLLLSGTCTQ